MVLYSTALIRLIVLEIPAENLKYLILWSGINPTIVLPLNMYIVVLPQGLCVGPHRDHGLRDTTVVVKSRI